MKQIIFIIIILALIDSTYAQQESEYITVKPVAYEKGFWLSSPQKPIQIFIVEVQNANRDLHQIVYFPETDGLRGGTTKFVAIKTLNDKTLWKLKLRNPSEKEKFYCRTNNFIEVEYKKKANSNKEVPVLRFRSTQMDADIKFNNLSEMPCVILESFSE